MIPPPRTTKASVAAGLGLQQDGGGLHAAVGRCDEPGEPDDVGVQPDRRPDEVVGPHVDPEVVHGEAEAAQHRPHEVLADVVDVARDRAQQHDARRLAGQLALELRPGALEYLFEDLSGKDEAGEVVLPALVALADDAHGLFAGVYDGERAFARGQASCASLSVSSSSSSMRASEMAFQLIHGASSSSPRPGPTCVSSDTWSARHRNQPQLTGRSSKS